MGNLISSRLSDDDGLQLSNGRTTVLLSVLLLSGSELARSVWERELMVWLAEHDQEGRAVSFAMTASDRVRRWQHLLDREVSTAAMRFAGHRGVPALDRWRSRLSSGRLTRLVVYDS